MTDRVLVRLALGIWVASVVMVLAGFGLLLVAVNSVVYVGAVSLMFSTIGAMVVRAQPRNRIGWILLAIGGCYAYLSIAAMYGTAALDRHLPIPGGRVLLWLALWSWTPALGMTATFLFLLFPDGRLPSIRWRWLGWLSGLSVGAAVLGFATSSAWSAFRTTQSQFMQIMRTGTPITDLHPPVVALVAFEGGVLATAFCMVASVVATVVRLRRAAGRERQQLQWFVFGAVAMALGAAGSFLPGVASTVTALLGFTSFVACVAVAMLRHRLYDIDRIINRTLVYGVLSAVLIGIYAGLALGLEAVVGSDNAVVVAGSTLMVAALFNPLRRRLQSVIDRRFYRRRYDSARTLEAFSFRLRDEVDLEELHRHLLAVVAETMQPAGASLRLRARGERG